MKILKNRAFALAVMLLLIVGGILIGSHRPLAEMSARVEAAFYDGVDGDGYGIAGDLEDRADAALNLTTIASKYLDAGDPLLLAVNEARRELAEASSPAEKYRADQRITESTTRLYEHLRTLELAEKDASYNEKLQAELLGKADILSRSEYNRLAEEYNRTLSQFPANVLGGLTGIRSAEYFR